MTQEEFEKTPIEDVDYKGNEGAEGMDKAWQEQFELDEQEINKLRVAVGNLADQLAQAEQSLTNAEAHGASLATKQEKLKRQLAEANAQMLELSGQLRRAQTR